MLPLIVAADGTYCRKSSLRVAWLPDLQRSCVVVEVHDPIRQEIVQVLTIEEQIDSGVIGHNVKPPLAQIFEWHHAYL